MARLWIGVPEEARVHGSAEDSERRLVHHEAVVDFSSGLGLHFQF